jgi:TonB family protein
MSKCPKPWAAVGLLAVLFPLILCAQTVNGPAKKCPPPQATYYPDPPPSHYPKASATAVLNLVIDEKGQVLDARLVTSSGSDEFDRDAMVTVPKWRFKPSTCGDHPAHAVLELHSTIMH